VKAAYFLMRGWGAERKRRYNSQKKEKTGRMCMVKRSGCHSCMTVYKRGAKCKKCKGDLVLLEAENSIFAVLMYVCAVVGAVMILMTFLALPILILYSFVPIGLAVVFNIIDDRMIDAAAREKLG